MVDTADAAVIPLLARWVTHLDHADIPDAALKVSQELILDALGVGIAATSDAVGDSIRRWCADSAAPGPATVIAAPGRFADADAAFANATLMHALDFDDHGFGGHATACVLPAVLAVAQERHLDEQQLITAYVAGMEVFGRLAVCMPVPNIHEYGFHPTAVLGLVAAAAGVGKALGLTADELTHTVAISVSGGAGLTASFGTTVKPLHAGHTAASAVRAARLMRSGFTGNPGLLEADQGFGAAYVRGEVDWPTFRDALDGDFRLAVKPPSIKQWPCCGGNQRTIQNLSRLLRENGLSDADVAAVDVRVNSRQLTTLRYGWPADAYEAKFCLPFTTAVTLAKGEPTLAAFRDAYWTDEQVLAARERVSIIPAEAEGDKHIVTVDVHTRDGRTLTRSDFVVHGSAGDPMDRREVSDKYVDCCSYSKLAPEMTQRLHDAVLALGAHRTSFWDAWDGLAAAG